MKTVILLVASLFSMVCMAVESNHYYELLLEDKLSFQGVVEVDKVTALEDNQIHVEFYVTAYGESRPNACTLEGNEIVKCDDNWFY